MSSKVSRSSAQVDGTAAGAGVSEGHCSFGRTLKQMSSSTNAVSCASTSTRTLRDLTKLSNHGLRADLHQLAPPFFVAESHKVTSKPIVRTIAVRYCDELSPDHGAP